VSKKNILEEYFRWADDAPLLLKILSKMQFSSTDPNADFEETRRFIETVFRAQVSFRAGEVTDAEQRSKDFAPDTDLGDLLLIARGDEEALARFVGRRPQPIHRAKWKYFHKEFNEGIRHREGVASLAARHGARVLSHGWDTKKRRGPYAKKKPSRMGRKPREKTVNLGNGSPVILREPTPVELADVLSGDATTFGDRLLRVSIVGAGGWRATSPEDVDAFFREWGLSAGEYALLLREARAFIVDCVLNAPGAAFYEMNQAATTYLSGGRTTSEMERDRWTEPEIALSHDDGEEAFDGGEELLASEGPTPEEVLIEKQEEAKLRALLEEKLTPRERVIVKARREGKTWKKIAVELGITPAAARRAGSRLRRKIPPSVR